MPAKTRRSRDGTAWETGCLRCSLRPSIKVDRLLAELSASEWDKPCYHPGAIVPVRRYLDLRLMELFMLGWDIRSRLESEAHLATESTPIFMDLLCQFVEFMLRPASRTSTPVRLRFEFAATVPDKVDIVVEGEKAHMETAGAVSANVTLRCSTQSFVLLMGGRLSFDSAIADNRLSVEGENELPAEFAKWPKGF